METIPNPTVLFPSACELPPRATISCPSACEALPLAVKELRPLME